MSRIDLHIHTDISSDGEFSAEEILEKCREQEMELIAIADHNSVRGVAGVMGGTPKLKVIAGVELDCTFQNRNFHLLGYGFDYMEQGFTAVEQDILMQEKNAAEEKIIRFKKATGLPVDVSAVMAASGDGVVTGELIAEFVLAQEDAGKHELLRPYLPGGIKSDMPNVRFYWDFFSEGKPAFVPVHYLPLTDAAALIHRTGGIAVLAHPGQNLAGDDSLLQEIIAEGIDGMEVFSSYHSREAAAHYLEIAEKYRLLVTCGSDFHGKNKPAIRIGGHGAAWSDRELLERIKSGIPGCV